MTASTSPLPRLVGMLHAPPLPGAPRYGVSWQQVVDTVLRDAKTLVAGGFGALLLENFGDTPFFPKRVPATTATHLTALAAVVKREFPKVELGINCLRNDGQTALAVALASGASFIRVNVLCGAYVTDQGLIEGIAHDLLRDRAALDHDHQVKILADVAVKHAAPLAARPLDEEVHDLIERGGADAVIVTGAATGKAAELERVAKVKHAAIKTPVYIGSGAAAENVAQWLHVVHGVIVGTSLKEHGRVERPLCPDRVKAFVHAAKM